MTNWNRYWASPKGRAKRMKARAKAGRYTKKFRTQRIDFDNPDAETLRRRRNAEVYNRMSGRQSVWR